MSEQAQREQDKAARWRVAQEAELAGADVLAFFTLAARASGVPLAAGAVQIQGRPPVSFGKHYRGRSRVTWSSQTSRR